MLLTTESHNRRPRRGQETEHFVRMGMDIENEAIRTLARESGPPPADTEKALDYRGDLFLDYVHVIPEGNRLKAHVILKAMLRAGLLGDHGS